MGFGDLVGDAFDAVGDAAGNGLGLAMDVAKAYTTAADETLHGDRDLIAQAKTGRAITESYQRRKADYFEAHRTAAKAVGVGAFLATGGAQALEYPLDKVQRGISTYGILNSGDLGGPGGIPSVVSGIAHGRVDDAWRLAKNASPGQTIVNSFTTKDARGRATGGIADAFGIEGATWENIHDYGERGNDRFSPVFSFASGSLDAAITWKADPLVGAGRAAKAVRLAQTELRAGDVAATAAEDTANLTRRQTKVRNQFDAFIEDTDGKTASELMKHRAFSESSQGAALASLFAKADGDHETKRLLWRTAMGDTAAKAALVDRRADLSFQIDRLQSNLDDLLLPKYTQTGSGLRVPSAAPAPDDVNALKAEIQSSNRMMDFLDRALGDDEALARADELGVLVNRDDAGVFGSVARRARVSRSDERRAARSSSWTVQDGVAGIPVRVLRSPTQRRPEGWIDLHDAEQTFTEIDRMTQRLRGFDPAERQAMLDSVLNAQDDAARMLAVRAVETKALNHIGQSLGYSKAEMDAVVNKMRTERDAVLSRFREQAYGTLEDGTVIRNPIMETQLANQLPTFDVDHVYRVLKRNRQTAAAMRAAGRGFDVTEAGLDVINDLWKTAVLLRGGYVIRNIMDSQLRLLAHLGGLHTMTLQAENAGHSLRRGMRFGVGTQREGAYEFADAMGRNADSASLVRKGLTSAEDYAKLAAEDSERALNKYRGSGDWTTVGGDDPLYVDSYLRVVNQHLRQTEIAQRLLAGETPEQVARWLRSPEGRALRRRLVHGADTPEDLVQANVENLNHLVPREMWGTLNERALTHEDVLAMFPEAGARPPVNAEQIQWSLGRGHVAEAYDKLRTNWFQWANGLPDDVLGRHPMYVTLYRGRMRQLLHQADPSLEGTLTRAEQVAMETQARAFAKRQMKRYMFDVSSKSNLGHFVRFISPFYSAWEDVMVKYGRMIAEDPALVPQAWKVWTAPNNASFVEIVDATTGKPVPANESRLNDNEMIRLQAPFLEKYFSVGGVDISKASFNVVLQGDPVYLPGAGPMVQAPVNEIALRTDNPTVAEAAQALGVLPYGIQNQGPGKFFLPTVARNAVLPEGQQLRMKAMIAMTEEQRYRDGLRDKPPTPVEVDRRFERLRFLRVFTAAVSPVATQYKSPYQLYIDQYHAYVEKYGPDKADEKFYASDVGKDYFLAGASMSNNRTGVAPSRRADAAAKRVSGLIAKYPDFGWYFVGPDNVGAYDRNVYTAQTHRKVSPTGTDVWRDTYDDAFDAIRHRNAEQGWIEYQKLTARLEAIRIQRGLPNMQVKGAADLREIKRRYMESLQGDDAPAWAHDWLNDYEERDSGATRKFLEAARAATQDDRIKGRPDIAAMAQYLQARDAMRRILAARRRAGGSGTLAGNDDLEAIWGQITGYLVEKNVVFADTYSRYLERDDLSAKA